VSDRALPISVIVPVHNDEQYLGDCLGSLRDQTSPPAEIGLVDNGSTDRSVQVAETLGLPNLRIIRNRENVGATSARNIALDSTARPFAVFLDSDDFLGTDALELAYREFAHDNCDISLFRVAKTASDGAHILFEIEAPAKPMTGLEALAMTMPTWRLQTLGIYRRNVLDQARAKFSYHGFSDDELALCQSVPGRAAGDPDQLVQRDLDVVGCVDQCTAATGGERRTRPVGRALIRKSSC
jgi:glycosyltransferase involved in cell wall biosynthesis